MRHDRVCIRRGSFSCAVIAALCLTSPTVLLLWQRSAIALPPPDDQPEEVLRTEIITGARSPITGKPMTASEYAQLQAELQTAPPTQPELSPTIRKQVNLLKLRQFLKTFFPFIPIR